MRPIAPRRIEHLLVPLDGSHLAEASLTAATHLATELSAHVTLLHVLERNAPARIHGERHLTSAGEADAYLAAVASRFADQGIAVECHAHPNPEGDVAAAIADHASEFEADLIVLCAHGQGGMRGWLSGAMAQKIVRRSTTPLLLIRLDAAGRPPTFAPGRVLVTLDGTNHGEAALPVAEALALGLHLPVKLIVAVATVMTVSGDKAAAARLTPAATAAALDLKEEEMRAYLSALAAALQAEGIVTEIELARGDAVRVITEITERSGANILALATHGRAGLDALWAGSVGSKVVTRVAGPLLLVHPPERTAD